MAALPFLIELNLSNNQITSLASLGKKKAEGDEVELWPRLQHCYLNSNKITSFTTISADKLLLLDLSYNEISTIPEGDEGFKGHERLEYLDLSKNKLTNLALIRGMKNLKAFYASANTNIRKLTGLEECGSLEILHLRCNTVLIYDSDIIYRYPASRLSKLEVSQSERKCIGKHSRDRKD